MKKGAFDTRWASSGFCSPINWPIRMDVAILTAYGKLKKRKGEMDIVIRRASSATVPNTQVNIVVI